MTEMTEHKPVEYFWKPEEGEKVIEDEKLHKIRKELQKLEKFKNTIEETK